MAEIDSCRDDGRVYAKTLIDAGVPMHMLEVKGSLHGFVTLPDEKCANCEISSDLEQMLLVSFLQATEQCLALYVIKYINTLIFMSLTELPSKWTNHKPPLHEESLRQLRKIKENMDSKPVTECTVEFFRKQLDECFSLFITTMDYDGSIDDKIVTSSDQKYRIPIRIFTPKTVIEDPAIMIYCHGGGMVISSCDHYTSQHKVFSSLTNCIVVDAEYRKCPENKAVSGLNDCVDVTNWVLENKSSLGGTEKSAVGVSGDSAGGLCSIYVTHRVSGLDFQIPIYPWIDMSNSLPSRTLFPDGPICPLTDLKWFSEKVVDLEDGDERDTRWSPLFYSKDDVKGVPPALFVQAEIDPCRDDGREYAKTLINAGVSVEIFEVKGAMHGFIGLPEHYQKITGETYSKMAHFVRGIRERKLSS